MSDTLLQEVVKGNPIKVGQEEFDAHMLPINTRGMLQMEISRDSQARMHILMTQMGSWKNVRRRNIRLPGGLLKTLW